jgi:hypothetical protein
MPQRPVRAALLPFSISCYSRDVATDTCSQLIVDDSCKRTRHRIIIRENLAKGLRLRQPAHKKKF